VFRNEVLRSVAGMRGDVTEAAVLAALVRHGLRVLLPFSADEPYDLVVDAGGGAFVRVQCKTGRQRPGGTVEFNSFGTDHGRGAQSYQGRADVFGVYCPALDRVFMVPVEETARSKTHLRLRPARNGQERRVRYAEDFGVADWAAALLARRSVPGITA
jgi:hypothetical protein